MASLQKPWCTHRSKSSKCWFPLHVRQCPPTQAIIIQLLINLGICRMIPTLLTFFFLLTWGESCTPVLSAVRVFSGTPWRARNHWSCFQGPQTIEINARNKWLQTLVLQGVFLLTSTSACIMTPHANSVGNQCALLHTHLPSSCLKRQIEFMCLSWRRPWRAAYAFDKRKQAYKNTCLPLPAHSSCNRYQSLFAKLCTRGSLFRWNPASVYKCVQVASRYDLNAGGQLEEMGQIWGKWPR